MEIEDMSDTPKFEVIDRRKMKAEEEKEKRRKPRAQPAAPEKLPPAPANRRRGRAWWSTRPSTRRKRSAHRLRSSS